MSEASEHNKAAPGGRHGDDPLLEQVAREINDNPGARLWLELADETSAGASDYERIKAARSRPGRPERAYPPVICSCGRLDDDDQEVCPACGELLRQMPLGWNGTEPVLNYLKRKGQGRGDAGAGQSPGTNDPPPFPG